MTNNLFNWDSYNEYKRFNYLFISLLVMASNVYEYKHEKSYRLCLFRNVEENILKLSKKIGDRYKDKKFLFICNKIHYLFIIYNLNAYMVFLGIMGLLEIVLTYNPDTSKFNVEDSITKQFKEKLLIILYKKK